MPRFELIVITWDNTYMVCIYIQYIRKTICCIERNRVLILFIHQDSCRYNIY